MGLVFSKVVRSDCSIVFVLVMMEESVAVGTELPFICVS